MSKVQVGSVRQLTFHGWNLVAAFLEIILSVPCSLQNGGFLDRGENDIVVGPREVQESKTVDVTLVWWWYGYPNMIPSEIASPHILCSTTHR